MAIHVQSIDRNKWQCSAPLFSDYNYRQLWDFSTACAERFGAISEHIGVYQDTNLIGLAEVRIKSIPFLGTGIAYVNGGPLVNCAGDGVLERLKIVLSELIREYIYRRKMVLRIQPCLEQDPLQSERKKVFEDLGFVVSKQAKSYHTHVIDLSPPEEIIRRQLSHKWRTNLNNAEKRNLRVEFGCDEKLCTVFLELYEQLRLRKNFEIELLPDFYFSIQHRLAQLDKFLICIAWKDDRPISGYVSSLLGNTCVSLFAASNKEGLENNASNLLQWAIIRKIKEKGIRYYDLGGIDPEKNPGVYKFKKNMGGIDIKLLGPFEMYPGIFQNIVVSLSERCYRKYRAARKSTQNKLSSRRIPQPAADI